VAKESVPAADRAARDQLEDQTLAKPDRQRLVCMRGLPRLVADGSAPVAVVVTIPRRYLGDELVERIRWATRADYDRTAPDRYNDRVAFIDLCLARNRFRKA
jgi:hypothetical protein